MKCSFNSDFYRTLKQQVQFIIGIWSIPPKSHSVDPVYLYIIFSIVK